MVKIAYFAEIFPSPSETWIHHEITELMAMGCEVRVFATRARPASVPRELLGFVAITTYFPEAEKSLLDGARLFLSPAILKDILGGVITDCPRIRLKAQVLRDIAIAGMFSRQLAGYGPQFVLVHFGGTRANLALIWSIMSGTPFSIKFHAADVFVRVALMRLKAKRAAKLMTISRYNLAFMRERYADCDVARCSIHKCGIPIGEYQFRPRPARSDSPVVVSVGRLVPMKGFPVLLRASKRLLGMGVAHRIRIYGDGPERARLTRLAQDLGLEGTVDLMGHRSPNEVHEALLSADVFVLPAVFDHAEKAMDGVPMVLIEAMAVGTPVVSTTISGIPELIEDDVSGFLATPEDPDALADAIVKWLRLDESKRRRMLSAARRKIESDHDVTKLSSALRQDVLRHLRANRDQETCAE
jgi:glycosyltransferase involved in cell wall biosynthesis